MKDNREPQYDLVGGSVKERPSWLLPLINFYVNELRHEH